MANDYGFGLAQPGGANPRLQEILMKFLGPQLGAAPAAPPQAPSLLDPQIEAQNRILSEPQPFQDLPVPKEPTTLLKILAGLADAAGTYAGGLNPYVGPPGISGALMNQSRERQEAMRANEAGRRGGEYSSRQRAAELKLRQLMGQRETEVRAQEKEADRAFTAAQANLDRSQRQSEREAAAAERLANQERDDRIRNAGFKHDEAMVRLRASLDTGKPSARDQMKALSEAKADANQIANHVPQLLKGYEDSKGKVHPPETPDQIRDRYRRYLNELNLDKDAMAAAMAYFDQEVESQLPYSLKSVGASEVARPRGASELIPRED